MINLQEVGDDDKRVYFSGVGPDIGKAYLEVVLSLDTIGKRGVTNIRHQQQNWYYEQLLGRPGRRGKDPEAFKLVDDIGDAGVAQKV